MASTPLPDRNATMLAAVNTHGIDQLKALEEELVRQRERMTQRLDTAATRAAVLVGAAGVLGGTQLLTVSGNPIWATIALALYLGAAMFGLLSMRPMQGGEVQVAGIIEATAGDTELAVRRSVIASNVVAHGDYVASLRKRSMLISIGFVVLAFAWAIAGAGVIYKLAVPDGAKPTVVQIEGDVSVDIKR